MAVKVTTKDPDESYIGLEVSGGPGMIRLILTWPYERAAEVVELPLDRVRSVSKVEEPHRLGDVPQTD